MGNLDLMTELDGLLRTKCYGILHFKCTHPASTSVEQARRTQKALYVCLLLGWTYLCGTESEYQKPLSHAAAREAAAFDEDEAIAVVLENLLSVVNASDSEDEILDKGGTSQQR